MNLPLGFTVNSDFAGSGWLFVGTLLALVVLLFLANHRKSSIDGVSRAGLRLILVLRFLAILQILLLLFDPQISLERVKVHPKRVAVLLDQSASMLQAWEGSLGDLQQNTEAFIDGLELQNDVDLWGLDGQKLTTTESNYPEQQTLFEWTPQLGRGTGVQGDIYSAVFLISDGHLNGGRSPLDQAWSEGLPIYPILPLPPQTNESLQLLDASFSIDPQNVNQVVAVLKYQQVGLQGRQLLTSFTPGLGAQKNTEKSVIGAGFGEVRIPMVIRSDKEQRIAFNIQVEGTEIRLKKEVLLEAKQPKKKILLVSERVSSLHRYLVSSYPDSAFEVFQSVTTLERQNMSPLKVNPAELELLVLNQITEQFANAEIFEIVQAAVQNECPVILFLDPELPLSNQWSELFGIRYTRIQTNEGEASLEWGRQAKEHPFVVGLLGRELNRSDLFNTPPIQRPAYNFEAPGVQIWDLGIGLKSSPAMVLADRPAQVVFSGGNYWKLFFYPESAPFFTTLWKYLEQYLQDIANFKPVQVKPFVQSSATGSVVPVEIMVSDIDGSPIQNAELRVWQEDLAGTQKSLDIVDSYPGVYASQLQTQKSGTQLVIAEAYRFGELWGRDTSKIDLMAFSWENQSKGVDQTFLGRLANRSGGKTLQLDQDLIPTLPRELYTTIHLYKWHGLRSSSWIVILFCLLFSEWIIRRRQGLL